MTEQNDEDQELFDLIGAIGTGIEASRDESLPPVVRDVAQGVANRSADKLADLNRARTVGDGSAPNDHL